MITMQRPLINRKEHPYCLTCTKEKNKELFTTIAAGDRYYFILVCLLNCVNNIIYVKIIFHIFTPGTELKLIFL